MAKSSLITNVSAVLVGLVVCVLGLVILMQGRELVLIVLVSFLGVDQFGIRFWTQLYYILAGLAWMSLFFLMDMILKRGIHRRKLALYSLNSIGIVMLILGVVQAVLTIFNYLPRTAPQVALTSLELIAGIGLIVWGKRWELNRR